MRARVIILVILAIVVGYGTFTFARNWLAAERASLDRATRQQAVVQPEPANLFVLVATEDLVPGRFLQPEEDVRWQAWPDADVPETFIARRHDDVDPAALEELDGVVNRASLMSGQPIGTNQLVRPGDRGFLAAVLQPGMRAVTVSIGDRSGVAGLIHAGDRVDVLLSHGLSVWNEEDDEDRIGVQVSETILRNVRVIALDRRLGPRQPDDRVPSTATLEVTPRQAEMVHVMTSLGSISLSLRSLPHTREDGTEFPDKRVPLDTMIAPLRSVLARLDVPQPAEWPGIPPERSFTLDREISPVLSIMDGLYTAPPTPEEAEPENASVEVFRGSAGGGQTIGSSSTLVGPSVAPADDVEPDSEEGPET